MNQAVTLWMSNVMKIGIAGAMTLGLLNLPCELKRSLPIGYSFPMTALLVNALIKRDHEVVAFTTSLGIEDPIVVSDVNFTLCIAPRTPRSGRNLFRVERQVLTDLMRRYPVEILHAHWSYEFAWAALDSRIPTLVTLHDHAWSILRYQFDAYRIMRLIMNYNVLSRSKYLSTNSQYLFSLLGKRDQKKARVIANFYSWELEAQSSEDPNRSNVILSVSNGFGRRKNITTALRAFALIRKKWRDVEYHLVGDGMEMGGPAHEYAVQNEICDGVWFIGKLAFAEVVKKMKQSLIFLHPAREESFGMSVLEAMVLGTPVVAGYQAGNVPFILKGGEVGLLCDVRSAEDIAQAVLRLSEDRKLLESLSMSAMEHARNQYREDVIVPQYEQYYRDILNSELGRERQR